MKELKELYGLIGQHKPRQLINIRKTPKRTRRHFILELCPVGYPADITCLADLKLALRDVLLGLDFLHRVHRDVRSPNVIRDEAGGFRLIDLEHSGRVGTTKYTLNSWPLLEEGGVFKETCDLKMLWSMAQEYYRLWIGDGDGDANDFMLKLENGENVLNHPWIENVS